MYYLNLDEDGYLLSVYTLGESDQGPADAPALETLDGLDLSGARIGTYKWDGEGLTLDEGRFAELQAEAEEQDKDSEYAGLLAQLRATDGDIVDALEGLLAAGTATELVKALKETRETHNDILMERKKLRAEILNLTAGGNGDGTETEQ